MKFDRLMISGKNMFDQAANLGGLSTEVRSQLEFEQLKATSRLVPMS